MRHLLLLPALCAFRVRGLRVCTCVCRAWRHARTHARTHIRARARAQAIRTHGRTNGQMYEFAPVNAVAAAMNARGTRSRTSSVRVEGLRAEGPPSSVHRRGARRVHIVVRSAAVGMCTPLSRVTSDDTDASPRARQRAHHLLHALRYLQATTCPVHPVEYLHIHYIPRALSNATLRIEIDRVRPAPSRERSTHTRVPRSRPRLRRRNSRSP
jgi:hypothetical protein